MRSFDDRFAGLLGDPGLVPQGAEMMNEYWMRPNQVVVHEDALGSPLEREFERWDAELDDDAVPERLRTEGVPVRILRTTPRLDLHALCRRFRESNVEESEPLVGPNHVMGAVQFYAWNPADLAEPADEGQPLPDVRDEGIVVGIVDTGVVLDRDDRGYNPHEDAHRAMALDARRDRDPLDTEPHDGLLDLTDVHGGFIADIVRRHAPEAVVTVARGLEHGVNDEVAIAESILRLWRDLEAQGRQLHILNLSLGGYTDRNLPPWPIAAALDRLSPRPVVVASAGNYGRSRPFWPAALKGVIGVGAVDTSAGASDRRRPPAAAFTNHGPWVDACAAGRKVHSTFVRYEENPSATATGEPRTFDGWARWSGTSFAAPRVAARIADRAAALDLDDPFDAVWQAAWELVWRPASTHGTQLGVYVD